MCIQGKINIKNTVRVTNHLLIFKIEVFGVQANMGCRESDHVQYTSLPQGTGSLFHASVLLTIQ